MKARIIYVSVAFTLIFICLILLKFRYTQTDISVKQKDINVTLEAVRSGDYYIWKVHNSSRVVQTLNLTAGSESVTIQKLEPQRDVRLITKFEEDLEYSVEGFVDNTDVTSCSDVITKVTTSGDGEVSVIIRNESKYVCNVLCFMGVVKDDVLVDSITSSVLTVHPYSYQEIHFKVDVPFSKIIAYAFPVQDKNFQ